MEDYAPENETEGCEGDESDSLTPSLYNGQLYACQWSEYYLDATSPSASESPFHDKPGRVKISKSSLDQVLWGEGTEAFDYFRGYSTGEDEWGPTTSEESGLSAIPLETSKITPAQEVHRKSIFVHSSPMHFKDINRARKSAFGSIFLKTAVQVTEGTPLLKTAAESNYSMVQSMLNSFEKIMPTLPLDSDRKQLMVAYKESLMKTLEQHGITKTYSDGSVFWDIYPITKNHLFSIQIGDRIHQTRNLSRIEDRIVHGPEQHLRNPYKWSTNSIWTGYWDELGMAGTGSYVMPHGVTYYGKMKDGVFHDDDATLVYPNQLKALHCVYENGKMLDCQFQFPDDLVHEPENWDYCQYPDRRFWSEVKNGLKPARMAQKTEIDPPRKVWSGCYDTGDGFYNPKQRTLNSPSGDLLRVPLPKEDQWIKKHCRTSFTHQLDFRPDFYEDWFNNDKDFINLILQMQEKYRSNKITYEQLQEFYADHNLIPPWKMKRKITLTEREEFLRSIPDPVALKDFRNIEKHHHRLRRKVIVPAFDKDYRNRMSIIQPTLSRGAVNRKSKSFVSSRESRWSKLRVVPSQGLMNIGWSKINFELPSEVTKKSSTMISEVSSQASQASEADIAYKRQVPEKYLEYRQILRAPFDRKPKPKTEIGQSESFGNKKKCKSKSSNSSDKDSESVELKPEISKRSALKKKELKRYIKDLILEAASVGPNLEAKRHKKRLMWAEKVAAKSLKPSVHKSHMRFLEEIFESIPDKEEFCDSDPSKTCDLKELALDKFQILKYWGTRKFILDLKI